jgi:fructokinase
VKEQNRIGIDLGGTKIEGVVLGADGAIKDRRRVATPRTYDDTVRTVAELVAALDGSNGRTPVGVGIPGSPSPATGLIRNANSVWLNGRPLGADLSAALSREVRLANDANCFALSEATDGAGAGAGSVFGVILGTGVGGGVVIDGRIVHGAVGVGGEWGHVPLPWMTP